jgi:hypothetical protein
MQSLWSSGLHSPTARRIKRELRNIETAQLVLGQTAIAIQARTLSIGDGIDRWCGIAPVNEISCRYKVRPT